MTDRQTDGRTFVIVESLSRLKNDMFNGLFTVESASLTEGEPTNQRNGSMVYVQTAVAGKDGHCHGGMNHNSII